MDIGSLYIEIGIIYDLGIIGCLSCKFIMKISFFKYENVSNHLMKLMCGFHCTI